MCKKKQHGVDTDICPSQEFIPFTLLYVWSCGGLNSELSRFPPPLRHLYSKAHDCPSVCTEYPHIRWSFSKVQGFTSNVTEKIYIKYKNTMVILKVHGFTSKVTEKKDWDFNVCTEYPHIRWSFSRCMGSHPKSLKKGMGFQCLYGISAHTMVILKVHGFTSKVTEKGTGISMSVRNIRTYDGHSQGAWVHIQSH